jgi:hypothetical protein
LSAQGRISPLFRVVSGIIAIRCFSAIAFNAYRGGELALDAMLFASFLAGSIFSYVALSGKFPWKRTFGQATIDEVLDHLAEEIEELHPNHKERLSSCLVIPRSVPIDDMPGEFVIVVAEIDGELLHWSDADDRWALEPPSKSGGIPSRGCNRSELSHIIDQKFGRPTD